MTLVPRGRRPVRLTFAAVAIAAVAVATPLAASPSIAATSTSGSHGSGGRVNDAGDEAGELMESLDQFADARTAPTGLVAPGAYAAAYGQLNTLAPTPNAPFSAVTNVPYNADDPRYRDPGASNSSGGAGYASGRIEAVAVDAKCSFAGAGMGGVKRSCDNGATWAPIADTLPTQSIGSMEIAPDGALWVATGDGNTGSSTYVGAGVYRLADPDHATFTTGDKIGGTELDSQIIRRIRVDAANDRVFVAASRGLYMHSLSVTSGAWTRSLAPCFMKMLSCSDVNASYRDIANDVVVQPNTGGKVILANVAWRSGAAYNGFYLSKDGGTTWAKINPNGAINPKDIGNATLQYSQDGSQLYVVLESPQALNSGAASALGGVFVSRSGDAAGPYALIANSQKLAQSGSAERKQRIGGGYQPGVQAWYNQFLGVDPHNAQHVYLGLEEVYESWNGGATWQTTGRYWDFGFSCWSYLDANNTCDGNVLHSDQHAIAFDPTGKTAYVGNDGGLYTRPVSPTANSWTSLSTSGQLNTLQYYSVGVGLNTSGSGVQVWGGLQDNGVSLLDPKNGGTMVSPLGGDGGIELVDPQNGCRAVGEYVNLTLQLTKNCGVADGSPSSDGAVITIAPADPLPRFIAPFSADVANPDLWVAGGEYIWTNTKTWASTSGGDWKKAADTGAGHSITALVSNNGVQWAGWCGACNPGSSFNRGLMTNAADGKTYQQVDMTGTPLRMITGVTPDPTDSKSMYVLFGGYSRNWTDGPGSDLAGHGHLWKVTVGATTTWKDVSGNLPDIPTDNMLIAANGRVIMGTDLGVVETTVTSLNTGSPQWTWDNQIPVTVATQVLAGPDGKVYISTFGRGIYSGTL